MSWFNDILNSADSWLINSGFGGGAGGSVGSGGYSPGFGGGNTAPITNPTPSYDWSSPSTGGGSGADYFGTTSGGQSAFDSDTYSGSSGVPSWMSSPNTTFGLDGFGASDPFSGGTGGWADWMSSPNTYGDILTDTGASFGNNDPAGAYAWQTPSHPEWSWAAAPGTMGFGAGTDFPTVFANGTPPSVPNQSSSGIAPISSIAPVTPGMAPITGGDAEVPGSGDFSDQKRRQQQAQQPNMQRAYDQTIQNSRITPSSTQPSGGVPGTGKSPPEPGMNFSLNLGGGGAGAIGTLLSGGLAAYNMLRDEVSGQPYVDQLKATNANMAQAGQQLMQYLNSGTLPPALAQQFANQTQAAKTQAAAQMAARGLPADPLKNSMLAQIYADIDRNALASTATTATQLYKTGLDQVGLSQNTYLALQKIYADQDKQSQNAIMNFANALGKMSGGNKKAA